MAASQGLFAVLFVSEGTRTKQELAGLAVRFVEQAYGEYSGKKNIMQL